VVQDPHSMHASSSYGCQSFGELPRKNDLANQISLLELIHFKVNALALLDIITLKRKTYNINYTKFKNILTNIYGI
jgi:hypothetical protein